LASLTSARGGLRPGSGATVPAVYFRTAARVPRFALAHHWQRFFSGVPYEAEPGWIAGRSTVAATTKSWRIPERFEESLKRVR
jgi:hypothetical protein